MTPVFNDVALKTLFNTYLNITIMRGNPKIKKLVAIVLKIIPSVLAHYPHVENTTTTGNREYISAE